MSPNRPDPYREIRQERGDILRSRAQSEGVARDTIRWRGTPIARVQCVQVLARKWSRPSGGTTAFLSSKDLAPLMIDQPKTYRAAARVCGPLRARRSRRQGRAPNEPTAGPASCRSGVQSPVSVRRAYGILNLILATLRARNSGETSWQRQPLCPRPRAVSSSLLAGPATSPATASLSFLTKAGAFARR